MAKRELNSITTIFVHCSATPPNRDVTVKDIDTWHKNKGWDQIGYHYYIDIHGVAHQGRSIDRVGAHAKGNNYNSIGICYAGGVDENNTPQDTLTAAQQRTMANIILALGCVLQRSLLLRGHKEVSTKSCPSFNVQEKFRKEQLLLDMLYSQQDAT